MPKDTTEGIGSAALSQAFALPEADQRYLDNLGLPWECIKDGGTQWLIIHGWQTPDGYNHRQVDLALMIPPLYSDAQIDMVYLTHPSQESTGGPFVSSPTAQFEQKSWQRWSRHRTPRNPWRPRRR